MNSDPKCAACGGDLDQRIDARVRAILRERDAERAASIKAGLAALDAEIANSAQRFRFPLRGRS